MMTPETQLTNAATAAPVEKNLFSGMERALEVTRTNYPLILDKCNKAEAALKAVPAIADDEQDEAAERLLVKCRATYELVKSLRMEITAPLDALKEKLMEQEKRISNLAGDKGNEFHRVKGLRDTFMTAKVKQQKEAEEKVKAEAARRTEFARLKAEFEKKFFDNVVNLITDLRRNLDSYFGKITLETFGAAEGNLKVKPAIKKETFESWFETQTSLNEKDKADFLQQVRQQYTFENINGKYVSQAEPILQEYRDKLPALKIQLDELAALKAQDEEAAAKKEQELKDQRQKELADKEAADKQAKDANTANAEHAAGMETLEATFQAQLVLQEAAPITGIMTKRIAIVDCEPKDIVKVFSQVLFECFLSPSFAGHLKRNKQGMPLPADEYGVPQYTKWAEELLEFFAANCKTQIPGISFIEKTTTRQTKK